MKATVKLTIDLEVQTKRRIPFLYRKNYAKAVYQGEMEVGDIRIGESLLLKIFNDIPTEFVVRGIQRIPKPESQSMDTLIELYDKTTSSTFTKKGLREHTLQESVARLNRQIAENLKVYGLALIEDSCKVEPEPTYSYLPPNVGAPSYQIPVMSL